MSEELNADGNLKGFNRVYMTPNEDIKKEDSAETAIDEGRVRTEEEAFRDNYKISSEEKPQEEEQPLLAGKYKSAEDLEKAYKELETKLGSTEQKEEPTQKEVEEAASNLSEDLLIAGNQEWRESGSLTEATMNKFVEAGIPKQYVESYVEAMNAQAELVQMKINNEFGGEERIQQIVNWAMNNLSDKEIESYNDLIDSGDVDRVVTAYKSIESRMGDKGGRFLAPDTASTGDGVSFSSKAEMIEAMNSQKYAKDPGYRQKVLSKLARSKF